MVLRWRPLGLLLVLVLSTVLSGCVADEPPKPEAPAGDDLDVDKDGADGDTVSSPKALTKVDTKTAVFAPVWTVGRSWTYDVTGTRAFGGYSTTIGVVDIADDRYVLGADAGEEFQQLLVYRSSLFLEGVQKDSLALLHFGDYVDAFGFSRGAGETWESRVFGEPFQLTKVGVQTIEHGAGTSAGIRVEGTAEGQTLVIEYADDVKGLTLLEWKRGDETVVKYALTGAKDAGTTGLMRWNVLAQVEVRASGGLYENAAVQQFVSDGNGALLFLVGEGRPTTFGRGAILDPEGNQAMMMEDPDSGHVRQVATVDDMAGEWKLFAAATGGLISLRIFQIQVEDL